MRNTPSNREREREREISGAKSVETGEMRRGRRVEELKVGFVATYFWVSLKREERRSGGRGRTKRHPLESNKKLSSDFCLIRSIIYKRS
jgi:hypothetical protein